MSRLYIVFSTLIICLAAGTAYLAVLLVYSPSVPRELLLNEESYYLRIGDEERYRLFFIVDEIYRAAGNSNNKRVLHATRVAGETKALFKMSEKLMERMVSGKYDSDSARFLWKRIAEYQDSVLAKYLNFCKAYGMSPSSRVCKDFSIAHFFSDKDMLRVAALKKRYEMMCDGYTIMGEYMRSASASHWGDSFENWMFGDDSVTWVNTRLVHTAPITALKGVRERIRISLSKKYVQHLIDSLQRIGQLKQGVVITIGNHAIATMEENDFVIEPFQDDRQPISDRLNTHWEFGLTPITRGKVSLQVKLGIELCRPGEKQEVFYQIVPLAEITIL
jgi:hypothetical protein